MALITRQSKDSKLTIEEMDGNLTYLEELAQGGTGITSSFQVGFSEFIIENGLITQENDIWTYEGVLTVGKDTSGGEGKYLYGYIGQIKYPDVEGVGSIDPLMPIQHIYWREESQTLLIYPIETIGKVIIDEGEASELILQPSDFTVDSGGGGDEDFEPEPLIGLNLAIIGGITSGVISNPFPVVGGTHTIKIQYTHLQPMENLP